MLLANTSSIEMMLRERTALSPRKKSTAYFQYLMLQGRGATYMREVEPLWLGVWLVETSKMDSRVQLLASVKDSRIVQRIENVCMTVCQRRCLVGGKLEQGVSQHRE